MIALTKSLLIWVALVGVIFVWVSAINTQITYGDNHTTQAQTTDQSAGVQCADTKSIQGGVDCIGGHIENNASLEDVIQSVINTMLFLIGIIAVIMLIVGGIRFVISSGNQTQVEAARNTILYAIIGLVIAFVAWGIVNFVIGALSENP